MWQSIKTEIDQKKSEPISFTVYKQKYSFVEQKSFNSYNPR